MSISVIPHLNFRGRAREALAFYQSVFGGRALLVTYGDAHAAATPEQAGEVMWGQVEADDGFRVQAYDVQPELPWSAGENPFYVSVFTTAPEELTDRWTRLCEEGLVLVELASTAWSPLYGKVTDRFGVTWVLSVTPGA